MSGLDDNQDPAAVGAAVAALWARHRDENLDRVARIERAALALVEARLGPSERVAARADAHKLAGAAGTYGFASASQAARAAEALLSRDHLTPADGARLMEITAGVRGHLESAGGRAPSASGAVLLLGLESSLAWETIARLTDLGVTGVPLEPHEDLGQALASWRPGVLVIGPRTEEPYALAARIAGLAPNTQVALLGADPDGADESVAIAAALPVGGTPASLVSVICSMLAGPAERPPDARHPDH